MRRLPTLIVLSTFALAACGGGSDDAADTTAPAETAAPVEETAPAETTPAETAPAETAPAETASAESTPAETTPAETAPAETAPAEPASTDAPAGDAQGAVAVSMVEWAVEAPTEIAAGTVTFDVTNEGNFPHHFAIARGNSYEELPQAGGGAIDEAALGDDFLGRTANLDGGGVETIEFDLEPGNYVFFCNIAGTVSHAAQGQVLSVTVS